MATNELNSCYEELDENVKELSDSGKAKCTEVEKYEIVFQDCADFFEKIGTMLKSTRSMSYQVDSGVLKVSLGQTIANRLQTNIEYS